MQTDVLKTFYLALAKTENLSGSENRIEFSISLLLHLQIVLIESVKNHNTIDIIDTIDRISAIK